MSIVLNINSTSTVRYRDDCFGAGYDSTYYIYRSARGHYYRSGYIPKIAGVEDASKKYDIGYNPSGFSDIVGVKTNPIICDGLMFDTPFTDDTPARITDVPYTELRFQRPFIAIPFSSVDRNNSTKDDVILVDDTYYALSRVYFHPTDITVWGTGIKYTSGQADSFDGRIQRFGNFHRNPEEFRMTCELQAPIFGSDDNNCGYIVTQSELLSRFRNTSHNYQLYNELTQYTYGALFQFHITNQESTATLGRYYEKTIGSDTVYQLSVLEPTGWYPIYPTFSTFVVPFLSQDEYNAAYAASYKWDDATIQQIDQYIN